MNPSLPDLLAFYGDRPGTDLGRIADAARAGVELLAAVTEVETRMTALLDVPGAVSPDVAALALGLSAAAADAAKVLR